MQNLREELINAQEENLDLKKRIAELEAENSELKAKIIKLQSGDKNMVTPRMAGKSTLNKRPEDD